MKYLLALLLLAPGLVLSQSTEAYMETFGNRQFLQEENVISRYTTYDFSKIWTVANNEIVYGIIGEDYQRIHIKILSVEQSTEDPLTYQVKGKSMVKSNICDFTGTIRLEVIREVEALYYGVDDAFKDAGIQQQGVLLASYTFNEHSDQTHSGVFKGKLYSKWLLDADDEVQYDNLATHSDWYMNNAHVGVWESYRAGKQKICNWGDFRVPRSKPGFDIGAAEFSVAEEYRTNGWTWPVQKVGEWWLEE